MMNRRTFLQRLLAAAPMYIGVVCAGLAVGCGANRATLVRDPPQPIFGPRLAGNRKPATGNAHARQVSWNTPADWRPAGRERPWRYIVIHHSATDWGSAAQFDRIHRARGWDELGYHFVIGNGSGSGGGRIEVGSRWTKQKHGAHCKVAGHPEYNDFGIGICLVGNFNETRPTEAQMRALANLVRYLSARYRIPRSRIFGHGQLKATKCPGRYFDYADLWRRL